ncbi:carbohydrate sulfotransferase 8-like [Glandiceps talaboti]
MARPSVIITAFVFLVIAAVLIILLQYGITNLGIGVPKLTTKVRESGTSITDNTQNMTRVIVPSLIKDLINDVNQLHQQQISHLEDIQRRRKELVTNACRKFPEKAKLYDIKLFENILVDEKHKVLYCPVPKAANSNWRRVFLVLGGTFESVTDINQTVYDHTYTHLAEYTPEERKRMLQTFTKFMFSRHPFTRLLSAYIDKFEDEPEMALVRKYRFKVQRANNLKTDPKKLFTFEQFVIFLLRSYPAAYDEHWSQLTRHCAPCSMHYDFIGTYENLNEDANYVISKINANVTFPSFSPHKTGSSMDYIKNKYFGRLTDSQIKGLYKKYEMDFEMFNYTLDGYIKGH